MPKYNHMVIKKGGTFMHNQKTSQDKPSGSIGDIIVSIIVLVLLFYKLILPKIDSSWIIDEAYSGVKKIVYENYGEIPEMTGKLIYKEDNHYIVAIKYEIPKWNWKASVACHIVGTNRKNCSVYGITKEQDYNTNYDARVEELKALWGIK